MAFDTSIRVAVAQKTRRKRKRRMRRGAAGEPVVGAPARQLKNPVHTKIHGAKYKNSHLTPLLSSGLYRRLWNFTKSTTICGSRAIPPVGNFTPPRSTNVPFDRCRAWEYRKLQNSLALQQKSSLWERFHIKLFCRYNAGNFHCPRPTIV